MSDHSFNPILAQKYGIIESILINSFVFWTRTNAAKESNFHDNRYWSFGTPEYFSKYFPYLSSRQIKYSLNKMVKNNILLKGNYNIKGYDHTNWYSLSDQVLIDLNLDITCLQPAKTLIGQNCPIDRTKVVNRLDNFVLTIPDTKTDNKTTTTTGIETSPELETFICGQVPVVVVEETIISKRVDNRLLVLKESRKDAYCEIEAKTFLLWCAFHLKNGDKKKFSEGQMIEGLCKIIARGTFTMPTGFGAVKSSDMAQKRFEAQERMAAEKRKDLVFCPKVPSKVNREALFAAIGRNLNANA